MGRFNDRDAALETLLLALEGEPSLVPASGGIAFLRARPHAALLRFRERLECLQDFKPAADELDDAGFRRVDEIVGKRPLVLLLPERQKDRTLADLARGMEILEDGGALVVSLHNDWGAKRFEKHLAELAGEMGTLSKNHCRAFWARKTAALDATLLREWREMDAPRHIEGGRFWSRPGLFSWEAPDPGSQLLAANLPATLRGRVADLGAGWGFLSESMLTKVPGVESLDLYEADRTALECARRNLEKVGSPARVRFHWSDVRRGVGEKEFDFVVMNAPFHEGRQPDPRLGLAFIAAATRALKPGGELWMVANRHLPYERALAEVFADSAVVIQQGAHKILRGVAAGRLAAGT